MNRNAAVDTLVELSHVMKGLAMRESDDVWASLDLSMAQLKAFMIVVHTGGMQSRALATRMKVGPSAVTPVVDRLVAQKLVRREPDAGDRRVIWVRPTAKAMALHERLLENNRAALARFVDAIPAASVAPVQQALTVLIDTAKNLLKKEAA